MRIRDRYEIQSRTFIKVRQRYINRTTTSCTNLPDSAPQDITYFDIENCVLRYIYIYMYYSITLVGIRVESGSESSRAASYFRDAICRGDSLPTGAGRCGCRTDKKRSHARRAATRRTEGTAQRDHVLYADQIIGVTAVVLYLGRDEDGRGRDIAG